MDLNNLLQQTELSQADIARAIGVSEAAVSQSIKGTYTGSQGVAEKIKRYLQSVIAHQPLQKEVWIETQNTKNMRYIVSSATRRRKMCMIVGDPGTGKTSALKKIQEEMPDSILIELEPKTTYPVLLGALCQATGVEQKRGNATTANALYAYFRKSRRVLLIDEGETLALQALEGLRRLWDKTGTAIVLVGTRELERQMRGIKREQAQLYSRIYGFWKMEKLSKEELMELCQQHGLCEHIDPIQKLTGGNIRKATWLLEEMEDFAAAHGISISEVSPQEACQFLML